MVKVQCPNPQCKALAALPDEHLGRKVRCPTCQGVFTATALEAVKTGPRPQGAAVGKSGAGKSSVKKAAVSTVGGSTAGGSTVGASTAEVITVVARRVDETGAPVKPQAAAPRTGLTILWIGVAAAGLLLPIACAGAFVGWQGLHGRGGPGGIVGGGGGAATGSLHAGVEIGSKGVKSVVLEIFPSPEFGFDVEPQGDPETVNTTLVAGLEANNRFDPDALTDTARAVAKLCEGARAKNVPDDHLYVVGSSGLFGALRKKKGMPDAEKEDLIRANKEALSQAVQRQAGKAVRFIDAADEAERSFKGIVPRPYVNDAVLYDIGSGNTKAAYPQGADTFLTLEVPYGTKTYSDLVQKEMKKAGEPFAAVTRRLSEESLRKPLREQFDRKPGFRNRDRVYLSGGAVWALATYVHPENRRAMVDLTPDDLNTFVGLLDKDRRAVLEGCAARAGGDEKLRKDVEAEVKRVNDTFSADELRAGAEVFRALSEEGQFAGKKLYFARYGYFGWLLSYVEEQGATR
jgi:hypothetical protein